MPKEIVLRPTQQPFVNSDNRYPFFIGGIGSGKTFSGMARGLAYSQQPPAKSRLYGPRGAALAVNYPVLEDVVISEFFELVDGTGLLKKYEKQRRIAHLHSQGCSRRGRNHQCCPSSLILFRSLDNPQWARGLNLSWFFIDEGRHVGLDAFHVLVGRLRQPGFMHSGWTTSTPNGYDWMWQLAHEDSPFKLGNATWYQASTLDNSPNLPQDFLDDLLVTYKEGSPLYRQEVLGEFVGLMKGAVFEEFDPATHIQPVPYDPDLPLYSAWDFGIGDLGVVVFVQVEETPQQTPSGDTIYLPKLRIVGYMEAPNRNAGEWAAEWTLFCEKRFGGRLPDASYGDPAGRQRGPSGASWFAELRAHGVHVYPAPIKARDYAIHILRTMMVRDGVLVDNQNKDTIRFGQALASAHWHIDDEGNKVGKEPVHDWTSHGTAALGYLVAGRAELTHVPRRTPRQPDTVSPYSWQAVHNQIAKHERNRRYLGPQDDGRVLWTPARIKVPGAQNS